MNTNLQSIKQLTLFSLVTLLVSCGGGDKSVPDAPEPVPIGVVSGVVMLGPVDGAAVSIYEIQKIQSEAKTRANFTRKLLKELDGITGADGSYSIPLQLDIAIIPILVCSSGGQYFEPASTPANPVQKRIGNEQELCAVAIYKRGTDMSVHITHFSNLAYSKAKYNIEQNDSVLLDKIIPATQTKKQKSELGAISLANKQISEWIQLKDTNKLNQGVISIRPLSISDSNSNQGSVLRPGNKYGFAIAAISDLVEWLRLKKGGTGVDAFLGVSSYEYAQRAFEDMQDGVLNGKLGGGPILTFGESELSIHNIRHHFSLKIYAVAANKQINKTGFSVGQVASFAKDVNINSDPDLPPHSTNIAAGPLAFGNHGALFGGDAEEEINDLDITVSHIYPIDNDILKGTAEIRIEALDAAGILSAEMTIVTAGTSANTFPDVVRAKEAALEAYNPVWTIKTDAALPEGIPDGTYDLIFGVVSNAGARKSLIIEGVKVSNNGVSIILNNPKKRIIGEDDVAIKANPDYAFKSISAFKATVNDEFFFDPTSRVKPISNFIKFTILDPANANTPIANVPLAVGINPPNFTQPTPITRVYNTGSLVQALPNGAKFVAGGKLKDGKYRLEVMALSGIEPVIGDPTAVPPIKAVKPIPEKVSVNFAIDATLPIVAMTTLSGEVFSGDATIVATFSDPNPATSAIKKFTSGLNEVIVLEQGRKKTTFTKNINGVIIQQVTYSLGTEGWHVIKLQATDVAGNTGESLPIEIGFDKTPPTVKILNKTNLKKWWSGNTALKVAVEVIDSETGVQKVDWGVGTTIDKNVLNNITYPATLTEKTAAAVFNFTITAPQISPATPTEPNGLDGIYSITVQAKDYNVARLHLVEDSVQGIGIDRTAPLITISRNYLTSPALIANKYVPQVLSCPDEKSAPGTQRCNRNWNWLDVLDTSGKSITISIRGAATIQEQGYSAGPLDSTNVSTASGLRTVGAIDDNSASRNINITNLARYDVTDISRKLTLALPQESIKSFNKATKTFTVSKTCNNINYVGNNVTGNCERKTTVLVGALTIPPTYTWLSDATPATYTGRQVLITEPRTSTGVTAVITASDRSTPSNFDTKTFCYLVSAKNTLSLVKKATLINSGTALASGQSPILNPANPIPKNIAPVAGSCSTPPKFTVLAVIGDGTCSLDGIEETKTVARSSATLNTVANKPAKASNHTIEFTSIIKPAIGGCPTINQIQHYVKTP